MCLHVGTPQAADSVCTRQIPKRSRSGGFFGGCPTKLRLPDIHAEEVPHARAGTCQATADTVRLWREFESRGLCGFPEVTWDRRRCHEEGGGLNISTTLKKLQETGQFHQPCVPGWWLRPDRPKEPARAWGAAFHLCVKRCKCFMD